MSKVNGIYTFLTVLPMNNYNYFDLFIYDLKGLWYTYI